MDKLDERKLVPTVSRVIGGTIVELVYDATNERTALAVSRHGHWTLEQRVELCNGHTLVPYAPTNNLIRHKCVVLASEPKDHGDRAILLKEIEAYLYRYVDMSPLFLRIAAHYALLTWVSDCFNELPYLRFKGDYGSGKTRALIALGSITYKGFFASGASTVSPIFHTLDRFGGTLLLDEADLRFSDKTADLVKILNNGSVNGLPVLRTLQNGNKEFNPAAFSVFGPKIVAMRGAFTDQALESRFLTENMGLRPLRRDVPIHLPDELKMEALSLRNKLLHFRLTNLARIRTDATRALADIAPRLNQIALPLLSVVEDESLRQQIAALLGTQHARLEMQRTRSAKGRVIAAANEFFRASGPVNVSLRELAERASMAGHEFDQSISPREAGQILRALSIPLRKSHGNIIVRREDWNATL